MDDSSKQVAKNNFKNNFRLPKRLPHVRPGLRVPNPPTTKAIASPDITDDATDWRQIAAKLMAVD
jgi:hypothetical protein